MAAGVLVLMFMLVMLSCGGGAGDVAAADGVGVGVVVGVDGVVCGVGVDVVGGVGNYAYVNRRCPCIRSNQSHYHRPCLYLWLP